MLDQSRTILREYSNEALIYIQKIKELEDESLRNGVQHVREHLNSLKGLVPVYLYGVIEKTLTTAFDEFFAIIKSKNISYNKIAGDFYPFIFTDELNTFKSVTTSKSKNLVKFMLILRLMRSGFIIFMKILRIVGQLFWLIYTIYLEST